jgi:hypothetical protein
MKFDHGRFERAQTASEGAVGKTAAGPATKLVAQARCQTGR